MANNKELMLVKQIIADGYDNLESISYELDIPMDVLIDIKRQIQLERRAAARQREVRERQAAETRAKSIDRLSSLRRNYECVYNGISTKPEKKEIPVIIPDNEVVAKTIKKIDRKIEESNDNKQKLILDILSEINVVKKETMSIEQAEYLLDILFGGQLRKDSKRNNLGFPQGNTGKTVMYTVNTYKKLLVKKLVEAIKLKLASTNDLEELKVLNSKLPSIVEQVDYVYVSTVRMRIQSKIAEIKRKKSIIELEQSLSEDITTILRIISNGEIDDALIDMAIENEVQRRLQKQTGFYRTTREKQIEQVFYQIAKALENYAEKYPIQKPEKALELLEQKFGMGFDANFRAIIHNFIERKEFIAAGYFCDKYSRLMGEDNVHASNITTLKNDIKRAEIGQIILRGIHANATTEDRNNFFDFLERKMQQTKFSHNLIPLGKTRDGSKRITLADIWEDERTPNR